MCRRQKVSQLLWVWQVVVNLYPFRQTVTAAEAPSYETAVENIDIGGPAMIRAAAKNHEHVTVVVDPSDYQELLEGLKRSGGTSLDARKKLAWKAYQHTATYDSTVAEWFWSQIGALSTNALFICCSDHFVPRGIVILDSLLEAHYSPLLLHALDSSLNM